MSAPGEVSVSWGQVLGWRLERHLLDPVGYGSAADVVRRLGAVLSMDEAVAELAVRTRRSTSRSGELAQALADGSVIKAFAFRGSMHYLAPEDGGTYLALRSVGRQWELPSLGGALPPHRVGLARLPGGGARGCQRRAVDHSRAR